MGKSAKAKKRKNADFQKVKLKAGRKLKKGHETDTSFKAAKLVLVEQLKTKKSDTPVTHRRLSLQDLCSRLKHPSAGTRAESLRGLKELLITHAGLLGQSVTTIVGAVFPLISDADPDVRVALLAVLHHMLSNMEDNALLPQMNLLVSHIACGLTSQSEAVKSFALNLVASVLIPTHPRLVSSSSQLIDALLGLLPASTAVAKSGVKSASPGSTENSPISNPRMYSLKNRVSILICFTRLSRILFPERGGSANTSYLRDSTVDSSFQVSSRSVLETPSWPPFFVVPVSGDNDSHHLDRSSERLMLDSSRFIAFIDRLVPFLHDCWLEVAALGDDVDLVDFAFADTDITLLDFILRIHCAIIRHGALLLCEGVDAERVDPVRQALHRLYGRKLLDTKYEIIFPISKRSQSSSANVTSKKAKRQKPTSDDKRLSGAKNHASVLSVNVRLIHLIALLNSKTLQWDADNVPLNPRPRRSKPPRTMIDEKYYSYLCTYLLGGDKSDGTAFAVIIDIVSELIDLEARNSGRATQQNRLFWALIDCFLELRHYAALKEGCFETVATICLKEDYPLIRELPRDTIAKLVKEMIDLMPIWLSAEHDYGTQKPITTLRRLLHRILVMKLPGGREALEEGIVKFLDSVAELCHGNESPDAGRIISHLLDVVYWICPISERVARAVTDVVCYCRSSEFLGMQRVTLTRILCWYSVTDNVAVASIDELSIFANFLYSLMLRMGQSSTSTGEDQISPQDHRSHDPNEEMGFRPNFDVETADALITLLAEQVIHLSGFIKPLLKDLISKKLVDAAADSNATLIRKWCMTRLLLRLARQRPSFLGEVAELQENPKVIKLVAKVLIGLTHDEPTNCTVAEPSQADPSTQLSIGWSILETDITSDLSHLLILEIAETVKSESSEGIISRCLKAIVRLMNSDTGGVHAASSQLIFSVANLLAHMENQKPELCNNEWLNCLKNMFVQSMGQETMMHIGD